MRQKSEYVPKKIPFQPGREWSIHAFVYSVVTYRTLKHKLVQNCECIKSYEEETPGTMKVYEKCSGGGDHQRLSW